MMGLSKFSYTLSYILDSLLLDRNKQVFTWNDDARQLEYNLKYCKEEIKILDIYLIPLIDGLSYKFFDSISLPHTRGEKLVLKLY